MSDVTKTCRECAVTKPVDQFKPRSRLCKKCDNSRPRAFSIERAARKRAYKRAMARLAKIHATEYQTLFEDELEKALAEARALSSVTETPDGTAVALLSGPKMAHETTADRIREDVGRCPLCINRHDRGHICPVCGNRPQIVSPPVKPAYRGASPEQRIGA